MSAPATLAEIGDAIREQLHALANHFNPDYFADVAVNLEGARREVLRYRERLMRSEADGGSESPATNL